MDQFSTLSKEYVLVPVALSDTGQSLATSSISVSMAVVASGATPSSWATAEWETLSDGTTCVRALIGPGSTIGAQSAGLRDVWVRLVDNAGQEIPVFKAGQVLVY